MLVGLVLGAMLAGLLRGALRLAFRRWAAPPGAVIHVGLGPPILRRRTRGATEWQVRRRAPGR